MGWTITFKSLAKKTCTVAVGGGGTSVTPAANPIEWDEDDSDDLLSVVRWRTGNLRVVEQTYGELDAMHPAKDTDLPVVVTYDGRTVFSGYMQAQDFNSPWVPGRRTLALPIVSVLGTAGNRYLQPRYIDYEMQLELDASSTGDLQNYLGDDGKFYPATTNDVGRFVAIEAGKRYVAESPSAGRIAVVKSTTNIPGASADFATGCSTVELVPGTPVIFETPSDATHIYIAMAIGGTACRSSVVRQQITTGTETLGVTMKEICVALGITHVILPSSVLDGGANPLQVSVNSRTLCPFNDDYEFGQTGKDVFAPLSYYDFLEGFCNLYGLIVHDTNDADGHNVLAFGKFGYSGTWTKMEVAQLDDPTYTGVVTAQGEVTLESIFSMANADGKMSHVAPLGRLDIDCGELLDRVSMNLRLSGIGDPPRIGGNNNLGNVIYFLPLAPSSGGEFVSAFWDASTASYTDQQSQGDMTRTMGDGGKEAVDISYFVSDINQVTNTPLFEYVFSQIPRATFSLCMEVDGNTMYYRVQIQSGTKYVKVGIYGAASWVDEPTYIDVFAYRADKGYTVENIPPTTEPVVVRVMASYRSQAVFGEPVMGMSLDVKGDPLNAYIVKANGRRTIKQGGSDKTADINCLFHDSVDNAGRIIGGELTEQNDYGYMFRSQQLLDISVKKAAGDNDMASWYGRDITVRQQSGWRLIGCGFEPWNDNYRLMLMRAEEGDNWVDYLVEGDQFITSDNKVYQVKEN